MLPQFWIHQLEAWTEYILNIKNNFALFSPIAPHLLISHGCHYRIGWHKEWIVRWRYVNQLSVPLESIQVKGEVCDGRKRVCVNDVQKAAQFFNYFVTTPTMAKVLELVHL